MRRLDYFLLSIVFSLCLIGLFLIFIATYDTPAFYLFTRQAIFLLLGVAILIAGIRIPMRLHYSLTNYYLIIILISFIVLLAQGGDVNRWFRLAGVNIQPSEFAKIGFIFFLARYFDERKRDVNSWKNIIFPSSVLLILLWLLIEQPDLGTALLFVGLYIGILWWAGFKWINLFILVSPFISLIAAFHWISWAIYFVLLVFILHHGNVSIKKGGIALVLNILFGSITPFVWMRLYDYQKNRILVFLDPGRDPFGAGYQVLQSKLAIGSGGLWGRGFFLTDKSSFSFLPARYTDFIFGVLGRSFGLVGCLILLSLFLLLLYRGITIAQNSRNCFNRLVAVGIVIMIAFQTTVNILMSLGLAPVTGMPLPFITYGGSSLFTMLFAVGLLLNIEAVE